VPEGDTVWRAARSLDRALSGRVLTATDFRVPALATTDLSGRVVEQTVARGKHLLTRIGDDHTLHTHLKMEGSWHLYRPGSRWRRPAHEARAVLRTEEWHAVGFALGIVELLARDDEASAVGHLGPDLLGPDWSADEALRRLAAPPARDDTTGAATIGAALLDQRNLAGLGTVYMSETLFVAGVSPLREVSGVEELLPRIVDVAHRLIRANRDNPRQVTTGVDRRGQEHWVYLRTGKPCRRCGRRIATGNVGVPGRERRTYWCPHCQP
jgi:endonuclease-8